MKQIKNILLWIWQLPQNLLGLLLMLILQGETRHRLGTIRFYYLKTFPGGVTLGEYIFVGRKQKLTVRHEFGHVLQSRYLGPLYLIVIGLPSLLHAGLNGVLNCCDRVNHTEGYYHFYTEKWADRLGGVTRIVVVMLGMGLLWSCSPKILPAQRDTVTLVRTEIVERLVRDTVTVTLPQDSTSTVTTDTTSTLTIRAATSTATVSGGVLTHTLHSNPSYEPEVEVVYKDRIEYRDTTIYRDRVDVKEVERKLTGWQKFTMSSGYILWGVVIAGIIFLILRLKRRVL